MDEEPRRVLTIGTGPPFTLDGANSPRTAPIAGATRQKLMVSAGIHTGIRVSAGAHPVVSRGSVFSGEANREFGDSREARYAGGGV